MFVLILCIITLEFALSLSLQLQTPTDPAKFAGVKVPPQISGVIQRINIINPTPIQQSAISPLCSGTSCVLHASTGTGKTIAFLIPALKRLFDEGLHNKPMQAIIIAPTKELAEQIISDIVLLANDRNIAQIYSQKIYVRANGPLPDLPTAPIIVGTPWRILDLLSDRRIAPMAASNLGYLVLDEVDRLVPTKSRYTRGPPAPGQQGSTAISQIVDVLLQYKCRMQVVGASATVGRPLLRELHRLLAPIVWDSNTSPSTQTKFSHNYEGGYTGQFPVIRPQETQKIKLKTTNSDTAAQDNIIKVESAASRFVTIPKHIRHLLLVDGSYESSVTHKVALLKKHYIDHNLFPESRRALLFLPTNEDVVAARPVLKFFGLQKLFLVSELQQTPLPPLLTNEGKEVQPSEKEVILAAFTGTRGLHISGVDTVLVSEPPKSMDEYLHIAGRTGRMDFTLANRRRMMRGTVVTVADPEQVKRMEGWQSALGIEFEKEYVA